MARMNLGQVSIMFESMRLGCGVRNFARRSAYYGPKSNTLKDSRVALAMRPIR